MNKKKNDIYNNFKNNEIIKYVGIYFVFIISFIFLYISLKVQLNFINNYTAYILSSLLNFIGITSSYYGSNVIASDFSINVIDECTGLYEILVYSACVLAYPTSVNNKTIGIVAGTPLLLTVNMFRMIFLTIIGIWHSNFFNLFHYIIWQITLIIFVALVLLMWIFKVVKK